MDMFCAERVGCEGCHDGRVDAAGEAQDGLFHAGGGKVLLDLSDKQVVDVCNGKGGFQYHGASCG